MGVGTSNVIKTKQKCPYGLCISPGRRVIATAGVGSVKLWDFESKQLIAKSMSAVRYGNTLEHDAIMFFCTFSKDGKTLFFASNSPQRMGAFEIPSEIVDYDRKGGNVPKVCLLSMMWKVDDAFPKHNVYALAVDRHENIFTSLETKLGQLDVQMVNSATGKILSSKVVPSKTSGAISDKILDCDVFSQPHRKLTFLACAHASKVVRLHIIYAKDTSGDGKDNFDYFNHQDIRGHSEIVCGVRFCPRRKGEDRIFMGSGAYDGKVILWDVTRLCREMVYFAENGLNWSENRRTSHKYYERVHVFHGHTSNVHKLAFSPRGRLISSTSVDEIRVWDIVSGKCVYVSSPHNADIWSVALFKRAHPAPSNGCDLTVASISFDSRLVVDSLPLQVAKLERVRTEVALLLWKRFEVIFGCGMMRSFMYRIILFV